jgi:hypothetical protein
MTIPDRRSGSASWLTPKRLRAHGLILAVCLWSVYAWNIATPGLRDHGGNLKGTDFLHFYTLGSLSLGHRGADLYKMQAQEALATQRVPAAAGIRYLPLYPPQVSMFFAPLALLFYGWALAVWMGMSGLIYGLCCYAVWRVCPNLSAQGWTVALLAAGFPAFFHLIAWGQTSALALACFTAGFLFLRDEREFLAGVALGCLIFKPQLGLVVAVVFVSSRMWRVVGGAVLSAGVQLFAAWIYYGAGPLRQWFHRLLHVREVLPLLEPRPYQTHSLRTFWAMLIPWPDFAFWLFIVSALIVTSAAWACWRAQGQVPLALRYSALLLATVLVAPHLTVYDLVILAPAFLLLADWLIGQPLTKFSRRSGSLLYLAYLLPIFGPLAMFTHLQLSVLAMAGLMLMICYWVRISSSGIGSSDQIA